MAPAGCAGLPLTAPGCSITTLRIDYCDQWPIQENVSIYGAIRVIYMYSTSYKAQKFCLSGHIYKILKGHKLQE